MHDPTSRPRIRARIAAIAAGAALVASILPMTVALAAPATQLVVTATSPQVAGAPFSFTVTAKDGTNATDTAYVGTVRFTSTDGGATLPGNYTFIVGDAGVHTFTNGATLVTAGSQTITATDTVTGTITGTSSAVTVNAGAATQVRVETAANGSGTVVGAQNLASGNTLTVYAISRDASNNFVANVSATWSLQNITGGVVAGDLVGSGTSAVFTGNLVGSATIRAVAAFTGNSGTITVVGGTPTQVRVETAANGSGTVVGAQNLTAGNALTVYAISRDASSQFVANVSATWSLQGITGNVVAGDLVGSGTSATFTGHLIGSATIRAVAAFTGNSGTITVVAGPVTKLTFISTISTSTAGSPLTSSSGAGTIVVAATDAGGNVASSYSSGSVTLSINPGTPSTGGPGGLSCTSSGGLVNSAWSGSHITFTGCRLANSGQSYQLTATGNLASGVSGLFDVNAAGAAYQLAFRVQPGGGVAGQAWGQQPLVEVRDSAGNLVINDSGRTVSLQISYNPGVGILACSGGLSIATSSGRASFSGCSIDKIASGYTLVATSSGLLSATSSAFNITPGAASKLVFTVQPGAATGSAVTVGVAFPQQPRVAVTDAGGNVITTNPSIPVYLTVATGTAGGTVTCTSGSYAYTVSGVATFSGCSINVAGTYTLAADDASTNSPNLAIGYSSAFTIAATPAQITLSASPFPINLGASTTVTIQFAALGANRQVLLQAYNAVTGVYSTLTTLTTDTTGRAVYTTAALRYSTTFKAVFAGAVDMSAGVSNTFIVGVRRTATMVPSYSGWRTVAKGTKLTYGSLIGPLNGFAVPRGTFQIYKQVNGQWVFQTSATFATTSAGKATFSWTWSKSGNWYVRWRANSDAYNTTAYSPIAKVTVP